MHKSCSEAGREPSPTGRRDHMKAMIFRRTFNVRISISMFGIEISVQ